ncbi:MAG: hypothetical protein Q4B29_00210, partial [Candidatus Saccharibacteria bacterium]|nr:hypothetical protein [Candidatus Saccharibacteria bacterium]
MDNDRMRIDQQGQQGAKWQGLADIPFQGESVAADAEKVSSNIPYSELKPNKNDAFLNISSVPLSEFNDIYTESELKADRIYVENTRRKFGEKGSEQERKRLDKVFEEIFVSGVREGGWLGDWDQDRERGGVVKYFDVDARAGTEFEDYRHRVDAFSTLYFKEPVGDEYEGILLDRAILGFDATIGSFPYSIQDKFFRSYNDDKELPFGFSSIKYYCDNETHGKTDLVPRY